MEVASRIHASFAVEQERSFSMEKERSGTTTTQKYRGMINRNLASIAEDLELDDHGLCSFQCGKFVMVIEVPWNSNKFLLYTSVIKCLPQSSTVVMRKALEINYMTRETNSSTLAIVPSPPGKDIEITMCRSQRIDGVTPSHVTALVRTFLRNATSVQNQLDRALRSSIVTTTSSVDHRRQGAIEKREGMVQPPRKPPPPPRERELTPTISNKAADKCFRNEIRNAHVNTRSQRGPLLKDLTKLTFPLGLTVAAYSSKCPTRTTDVMRRLSCLASKALSRPRASSHKIHS